MSVIRGPAVWPCTRSVNSAVTRPGRQLLFCPHPGCTHIDQQLPVRVKRTVIVKPMPVDDVVAVVPMPPIVTSNTLHVKIVCRLALSLRWCYRPNQMPSSFDTQWAMHFMTTVGDSRVQASKVHHSRACRTEKRIWFLSYRLEADETVLVPLGSACAPGYGGSTLTTYIDLKPNSPECLSISSAD